jgi:hypothetical protein
MADEAAKSATGRGSPMRLAGIALRVAAIALVAWGLFLWVKAGDPTPEQLAAQAAEQRLLEVIQAAPDGSTIDVAKVFDVPWDRAVLMPAYAGPKTMNDLLGFDWFSGDDSGPQDEMSQMTVYVQGRRVVWAILTWDYDFADGVERFSAADAVFTVAQSPGPELRPVH